MSDGTKETVKQQFGAQAGLYVTSTVHAKGQDLPLLPELAGLTGQERVLDVATATGHTALALAPFVQQVIGIDLTPEMLAEAERQARLRGVTNLHFQEGDAEQLPFPDRSFHVVTCRIAAHHFPEVAKFCAEAARVLRPGGRLVVVDNIAPEDEVLDHFINEVERLRDPSHFRAHRLSQWEGYFTAAGLSFAVAHQFTTPMDREDWLARMAVPAETAADVRRRLSEAPQAARERFAITETGFSLHKAIMVGIKPES